MVMAIEDDSNAAGNLPRPEHQSSPPAGNLPRLEHQSSPPPRLSQSRLHNFSFPTWGVQKLLRCSNIDTLQVKNEGKEANEQDPSSVARPWNLRKRKAAGDPITLRPEAAKPASKVTVALSRKEIEEDFMLVEGAKPPRRRKKRPPAVQKKLDDLFPGLRLSGITMDRYKTDD